MCPSDAGGDAEQALSYPVVEICCSCVQCAPQGHVTVGAPDKYPLGLDWLVDWSVKTLLAKEKEY